MKTINTKKLKILYYIIISLNLLSILALIYVLINGYFIEYPRIQFKVLGVPLYTALFLIFLLPSIVSIDRVLRNKQGASLKKIVGQLFFVGGVLLLSFLSGFILLLLPPVESYTNSIENYLRVEKDIDSYANAYNKLFPEQIPKDAQNIAYFYKKYSDFLKTEATISASWTLSKQSYEFYKEAVLGKSKLKHIELDKYEVFPIGAENPRSLQLFLEYNNDEYRIRYTAIIHPH